MPSPSEVRDVVREMQALALKRRAPTLADVGRWCYKLGGTILELDAGGHEQREDRRSMHIDVQFRVERRHVETSCCLQHALQPFFNAAWEGLEQSMAMELWHVPPVTKHKKRDVM